MTRLPIGNVSATKASVWDIIGVVWGCLFMVGVGAPAVVIVGSFFLFAPLVLIWWFTYLPVYFLVCGHHPQRLLPQHPTEQFCDPVGPRDPDPMEFLMFWRDQPMAKVNVVYGEK